jgi:hypothetical protein
LLLVRVRVWSGEVSVGELKKAEEVEEEGVCVLRMELEDEEAETVMREGRWKE